MFIFFKKQLFVGNIDKSIPFDEVKNYFYSKYSSIISAKLIVNQQTGRSKGYAFFEFSNYKEFSNALNTKKPLIFGKQTLVLNSAKNRFDFTEEEKINELSIQNNDDRKSLDSLNFSNNNQTLSSTETRVSSIRNSKDSINFINNNNNDKSKNDLNNNNELQNQIEDSLKKLSEKYYQYDNKSSLFNYYCSPFIYNKHNKKDFFEFYKYKENENIHNTLYGNCPFELCKDK